MTPAPSPSPSPLSCPASCSPPQVWWHCQHSCSVECLSINPSGNVVVSGSRDGMMVLSNFSDDQVTPRRGREGVKQGGG